MYSIAETMDEIERGVDFGEFEQLWQTLKAAVLAQQTTNTGNPKLLDEMELFAVMCERAGNGKDARCVRSWVKQLRASA